MVKENKNIFVIQNGTQLLNAIEFVTNQKLSYKDNILIIVSVTDLVINDLKTVIIESTHFEEVYYLFSLPILKFNRTRLGRILSAFYAKYRLRKITVNKSNQLIIGNYQNVFCKYFDKNHHSNRVIIIDDGPSTIEFFKTDQKKLSYLNIIVENILGLKKYSIKPNLIFTRFYSQIKEISLKNNVNIIENKFSFLKSNICEKKKSSSKLFVGYPLVEENIIDIKVYIDLLNEVKDLIGEFTYIPHRRESQETIKLISKHIKVQNLGMPFEMYLFKTLTFPSEILGFFTTVLFNVNEMFGEKIKLKYIKLNNLKIGHIDDVEKLYNEISKIAELVFSYDIKPINK